MSHPWHLFLLGELRVQRSERVITRFKYQKVGGLLAYLAYHPRQMHSREILIDIFWPESPPDAARNNLSTALSSLRNQLEPPGTPAGTVIRADRYSVGINPALITTDVGRFEHAVQEAGRTANATERVHKLEEAVRLYQGRLLPGYYEDWIVPEQERLSGLFFDTISLLIQHLEQQNDLPAALRYARQAVSVDPLREEAHQRLMRLLAATGQPNAALRQFKELERLLEEELGEEPSASLRALYRQIEKQSGMTAPLLPATVMATYTAPLPASLATPAAYPTTFTFLLTDSEISPRQPEQTSEAYTSTLELYHRTLTSVFARFGGQVWKQSESGFLVAFSGAKQALSCAVAAQQALAEQEWPEASGPQKVRMAIHTGDVEQKEGTWEGAALHRTSRILTTGHGGQILLSEETAGLVRRDLPEEITLNDQGTYRLRDVPTPERLYQVDYPGMPVEGFPALVAETGQQARLPVQVTRFFGREAEISRIEEILGNAGSRLLTLTGTGGTGKTRLAIEAAGRITETYQGAVWFVPLADFADASLIPSAILDALHLPRSAQQEPLEQVITALSRQPSLLVLDNFEHLVEQGASIVQMLLTRVPLLAILVTSRQLLGLAGEQEFTVLPLPTPNGGEAPEQLSLCDSVRLFIDRAQAVMPHFQVTNHNAPTVAALCQRLEGIPLAIELAAARAQVLTPTQMLAQLSDRFALLTSRRRDVGERQRTLRGAIEWSYQLLPPELQRFFARLSVFRGGWTVEAAEEVGEEPLALDYLALLRESSLVMSEETEQGMRFRMMETIREYAAECLQKAVENITLRKRHANYFLAVAEEARPHLTGSDQMVWMDQIEDEHENLRTALVWLQHSSDGGEVGLRLSAALWPFWASRGCGSEGRLRYISALEHSGAQERTKARADALNGAGLLAWRQSDYKTSQALHEEALAIRRELHDQQSIAGSLHNLGNLAWEQGYHEQAHTLIMEALSINCELGNQFWEAHNLIALGAIAQEQGDWTAAREYQEKSLALYRALERPTGVAAALGILANVLANQGDLAKARGYYEEALDIFQQMGDKGGLPGILLNLGTLLCNQGEFKAGYVRLRDCLSLCRELGDFRIMVNGIDALAELAQEQGELIRSAQLCGAANALREAIGCPISPFDLPEYEAFLAVLRSTLGEAAFAAAWEAGCAMTWEQAVAYALEENLPT